MSLNLSFGNRHRRWDHPGVNEICIYYDIDCAYSMYTLMIWYD